MSKTVLMTIGIGAMSFFVHLLSRQPETSYKYMNN